MILLVFKVVFGLLVLAYAADKFVDGASGLARSLGISKLVVGLVIVGFGTSAPELLVSLQAALEGKPGLAIGNGIGSNISNIALVIGATAMIRALPVASGVVRREFPFLGLATAVTLGLLFDGELSRFDGVVMMALLIYILARLLRLSSRASPVDPIVQEAEASIEDGLSTKAAWLLTLAGLAGMLIGSRLLVDGATGIAVIMAVPDFVVGLTITAIGTSAPELAASIASARKGETDLVIGNVIGSNLFNTLAVLGIPAIFTPYDIPSGVLARDFPVMMVLTLLFFVASMTPLGKGVVNRREGKLFVAAFFAYQVLLLLTSEARG